VREGINNILPIVGKIDKKIPRIYPGDFAV
jgi:hypothetical protein